MTVFRPWQLSALSATLSLCQSVSSVTLSVSHRLQMKHEDKNHSQSCTEPFVFDFLKYAFYLGSRLKEHYIIGIKQKLWRPQIYIKLTQSDDDDTDSRKYPLKYFCPKFHSLWEINNLISRLEFIARKSFRMAPPLFHSKIK